MAFVNTKTGKPARADQELIVFPGEDFGDPDGIGVIIYGDGRVSGRWGDGTVGLNEDASAASEDETTAIDPASQDLYEWNGKIKAPRAKRPSTRSRSGKRSSSTPTSIRGMR